MSATSCRVSSAQLSFKVETEGRSAVSTIGIQSLLNFQQHSNVNNSFGVRVMYF